MDYWHVFGRVWDDAARMLLIFGCYYLCRYSIRTARAGKGIQGYLFNTRRGSIFAYAIVLFWVGLFTAYMWGSYGRHTESDDYMGGGNTEVVVDFEPTDKQRNEYGLELLIELAVPAIVAVYGYYEKNPSGLQPEPTNASPSFIRAPAIDELREEIASRRVDKDQAQ